MLFSDGGRKLEDVEHILEKCSDLVQAVKADKHCQLMSQTFDAITVLNILSKFVCIYTFYNCDKVNKF